MSDVDEGTHAIDLHVVVMGSGTDTLLSNLAHGERDGNDVRMRLGTVQGWTPTLHFHAFGHDPWEGDGAEGERLAEVVPKMDALILTDGHGHGYSSKAVEHLTRLLKPAKIGGPTPWHQDIGLWRDSNSTAINAWLAIDAATVRRG